MSPPTARVYQPTVVDKMAPPTACVYQPTVVEKMTLVIICTVWLWLHLLFSAYPLSGTYLLTTYTYKLMRLLTGAYGSLLENVFCVERPSGNRLVTVVWMKTCDIFF